MIPFLEYDETGFHSGGVNFGPEIEAIFYSHVDWFQTFDKRYIYLAEARKLGWERIEFSGTCYLVSVNGVFYQFRLPKNVDFKYHYVYKLSGTYPKLHTKRTSRVSVIAEFNSLGVV